MDSLTGHPYLHKMQILSLIIAVFHGVFKGFKTVLQSFCEMLHHYIWIPRFRLFTFLRDADTWLVSFALLLRLHLMSDLIPDIRCNINHVKSGSFLHSCNARSPYVHSYLRVCFKLLAPGSLKQKTSRALEVLNCCKYRISSRSRGCTRVDEHG